MTNSARPAAMALIGTLALLGPLAVFAQDPPAKPWVPQATGRGSGARIECGVFAPDGETFFSAGADKIIRAWNVADGKELFKLPGHGAAILALGMAGDKLLVSAGEDGSICLWDLAKRVKAGELPRHQQPIHCLAISRDGAVLATGGGIWNKPEAGELRLWDLASRKEIARLEGHRKIVLAAAFSPDGRRVAVGDQSGDLKIWDLATRKPATLYHEKIPSAVQYSPDGKWLAVGDYWGRITLYDADTLNEDSVVRAHRGIIFCLDYALAGNMLATAGYDGAVRLWNSHRLEEQAPVQVGVDKTKARLVRFAPDGKMLASAGEDALVYFWAIPAAMAKHFEAPAVPVAPAQPAPAVGPARVALVCSQEAEAARTVQDLALAKLTGDANIVLLDRSTVERLLGEQKLSLSGLVDAGAAVKAGKILAVDLLAIVEHSSEAKQNTGFVIFNAATGAKLADAGFTGNNLEPQALHVAAGVRAAAIKWRAGTKNLKTLCLLPVRNADLPRSMDRFCETLGAALERDLLGFEGTALLERKRLDLVNKEKTLAEEAANRELLASLAVLELEISRAKQGAGIRAAVTVRDNAGKQLHRIVHEVDDPNGAGLLAILSTKIQQALKNTAPNAQANRNRESRRFLREAQLLWTHKYYAQGLQAAETAFALKPSDDARQLLAEYLMRYATELIHPGGMRTTVYGKFEFNVQPEKLREALDLSWRGLQLLEASRSQGRIIAGWVDVSVSLEPALVADARRFLFNKIPYVRIVPANAEAQQEFDDFRRYCLERLVARCYDAVQGEAPNAVTLDRFTYVIQDSTTSIGTIAPTRAIYTKTLHDLAMKWLDLAGPVPPASMSPETALKFGEFLGQIYLPNMLPGAPAPDDPTALFDRALNHPHPIVRLSAGHHYRRLMVKLENMPIEKAVAGHRELLAEGMRLIDNPPIGTPDRFRVAMYRLLNDAIGHLYIHKAGRDVAQEYFDLCDFMLARNDVVEDVVRAMANSCGNQRANYIKALQIIDKSLEVTDSPGRRIFADSPVRFKFYMKEARRTVLAQVPDLEKVALPWESVKTLVGIQDLIKMKADLLIAATVHDKHIYYFTGGADPASKHRLLQLLRMPVEGGPATLLGKTVVSVDKPPAPNGNYVFWISPEPFVTTTAIAHDKLYAGTVSDGILVFPLTGGNPTRIGEKEGLPSKSVHKLVVVDNALVAALEGGYIVTHDLATGRTDTVASSRRAEKLSPFDNSAPFRVNNLVADPKRQRVLFQLNLDFGNDPRGGLWEFNLKTRQFKKLHPTVAGAWSPVIDDRFYLYHFDGLNRFGDGLMAYDLALDQFLLVHGKAAPHFPNLKTAALPAGLSVPFPRHLLHDGFYWSAYPFGRRFLGGAKEENFPSLHDQGWKYGFSARVSLQAVSPNELLIGDLSGLYLVRLKPKAGS